MNATGRSNAGPDVHTAPRMNMEAFKGLPAMISAESSTILKQVIQNILDHAKRKEKPVEKLLLLLVIIQFVSVLEGIVALWLHNRSYRFNKEKWDKAEERSLKVNHDFEFMIHSKENERAQKIKDMEKKNGIS